VNLDAYGVREKYWYCRVSMSKDANRVSVKYRYCRVNVNMDE
jgi:hypothetical protein